MRPVGLYAKTQSGELSKCGNVSDILENSFPVLCSLLWGDFLKRYVNAELIDFLKRNVPQISRHCFFLVFYYLSVIQL